MNTPTLSRRQKGGFSLAEVLVAMFVIVIGISGVTSAIYWGLENQDSGKSISEASNHAELLLERVVLGIAGPGAFNTSDSERTDLYAPPFDGLADYRLGQSQIIGQSGSVIGSAANLENEIARFKRNIQVEPLTSSNGVNAYRTTMNLATVKVYWTEKGHERHVTVEGVYENS